MGLKRLMRNGGNEVDSIHINYMAPVSVYCFGGGGSLGLGGGMTKIIEIQHCGACPFIRHSGANDHTSVFCGRGDNEYRDLVSIIPDDNNCPLKDKTEYCKELSGKTG